MPRYVRVLETAVGTPRVSDTLARWVDVDDLIEAGNGVGTVTLETPTGDVDGVNNEFVFIGTPVAIFRNGVLQAADVYTIVGTTVTFDTPPASGAISGLTQ